MMKRLIGNSVQYYVNVSQLAVIGIVGALGWRYLSTLREANGMQKHEIKEKVKTDAMKVVGFVMAPFGFHRNVM